MAADAAYLKNQILLDVGDIGRNAQFEIVFPVEQTGGAFKVSFAGAQTDSIDWPNNAAAVQEAMEALISVGEGNVAAALGNRGFILTFQGDLGLQELPKPSVDGSDLTPEPTIASIPVVVRREGRANHWDSNRIDAMWDRRDTDNEGNAIADLEYRFLLTKLDAITETKGLVWTLINTKTGDQQRDYADQNKHLQAMEQQVRTDIDNYWALQSAVDATNRQQTHFGGLTKTSPSGKPFRFPTMHSRGLLS